MRYSLRQGKIYFKIKLLVNVSSITEENLFKDR